MLLFRFHRVLLRVWVAGVLGAARVRVLGVECCSASYAGTGYPMTANSSRGSQSWSGRGQRGWLPEVAARARRPRQPGPCGVPVSPRQRRDGKGVVGLWLFELADLPDEVGELAGERDHDHVAGFTALEA